MANKVGLKKVVEKMNLKNLTPDVDLTEKKVEVPDINRPALQLTGFFEHFDSERVQIIGYVEYTFLETMDEKTKEETYETLLSYQIPCIIFCRNLPPEPMLLEKATRANIPVFITEKQTSEFTAEIIRWLNVALAPCISIHGVLVDVYGVGVLIMGESGIGKSEAALELIKRGHRLVSDDVVEIRKVSDETLIGSVVVGDMNWQAFESLGESYGAMVKLRYRSRPCACIIEPEDDQRVSLALRSPQPTTAPGQYAVLYDGDTVLGGGMIEEVMHA